MSINELRRNYHQKICETIIRLGKDKKGNLFPNFADVDSRASTSIAKGIVKLLGYEIDSTPIKEQTVGSRFEGLTKEFLENSFQLISHLRPGEWVYQTERTEISNFDQYEDLASIAVLIKENRSLSTVLGREYIVKPDIIVARAAVNKKEINAFSEVIQPNDLIATLSPFIAENTTRSPHFILHASISCKWTIRSDRSQNTRTEALNLIRNRKGHVPHIVAVTAEPLPTRIAALALGTGDLDCVYHFALPELEKTIVEINNEDQRDMLHTLISGKRLRDISDLPFDLAA